MTFWPAEYRNVEPGGPLQFTRPTVLLVNRASASGGDTFVLAMRVLPHVTVAGDVTEGALSAQFPENLPNGWTLWVAFKVMRDQDGVCWDGVARPDLRICNTAADIAAGRDRVLEFAVQFLEKGLPAPQDEADSLKDLKTSLVEEYVACAKEKGVEAAVAGLRKARAAEDGASFFGPDEAVQQAGQYLGRKQYAEAIGLLTVFREAYPQIATTYGMLAYAYVGTGDIAAAELAMKQGEKVEPMLSFEPQQIERAGRTRAPQGPAGFRRGHLRQSPGRRWHPIRGEEAERAAETATGRAGVRGGRFQRPRLQADAGEEPRVLPFRVRKDRPALPRLLERLGQPRRGCRQGGQKRPGHRMLPQVARAEPQEQERPGHAGAVGEREIEKASVHQFRWRQCQVWSPKWRGGRLA